MKAWRAVGILLSSCCLACLGSGTSRAFVGDTHRQFDVDLLGDVARPAKPTPDVVQEMQAAPAWLSWQAAFPGWQALWNARSRSVRRAWGPGVRASTGAPTTASIEHDCRELLDRTADWTGIDTSQLRLVQARRRMDRWYVVFEQMHDDLPVVGGRVDLRLAADGQLMLLGANWVGVPLGSRSRNLDSAAALRAAQIDLPHPTTQLQSQRSVLVAVPGTAGATLRLADEMVFRTEDPPGLWRCLVDAQSGRLLQRQNQLRFVDVVGNIAAQVEPSTPFDTAQPVPLQDTRLNVGNGVTEYGFTDAQGDFSVGTASSDSVDVFLRLAGAYARVYNDELGQATPRIDAKALPGSPRNFMWDDSNSRASERDAYKNALVTHDFIKQLDPSFTGVDYIMPVVVDIGGRECNAWWDGYSINFLQSGEQCVNTARIADVVYHEYGHAITDLQYRPFAPSGAMHEGFSDYLAASMRNDPDIGNGFRGPGTTIRSVDNTLRTPDDLTGEVHADGLIIAGALWHLRTLLGAARTDSLFHFARYGLADNFDDYMLDVLVTDDDNGNIYDGTPNMDWIIVAFSLHGIGDYSVQISHQGLADTEDAAKPLTIESTILSLFPLEPTTLILHYSVASGPWTTLPLQDAGGVRRFSATLPAQTSGTSIAYWLEASDTQGNTSRWPGPDPGDTHTFLVGPDTTPPVLSALPVDDRPLDAPGWRVRAQVDDNLDHGMASVDLLWSRGNTNLDQTLPMVMWKNDVWEASIPPGAATLGDVVSYAIVGTDSASSPNSARLPSTDAWSFKVVQGFSRDFEADDAGLTSSGEWEWGMPTLGPDTAWSGQNVWATRLDGGYSNNTQSDLVLPALDLGTWASAALRFRHWFASEDYWDGGRVEISTDNGISWKALTPDGGYPWAFVEALAGPGFSGHPDDWQVVQCDLSRYRGMNVLLRLHFASDGGITDVGWVVDDIEVVERQVLAVPLHLQSSDGGDQQVPLAWDPPAGIDPQQVGTPLLGYNVMRGSLPDLSDATQINATRVMQETYVDDTVVNGLAYTYAVRAVYANGESPLSASTTALPYRAVYAASVQELLVEAAAGAGVDTSVTFSNAGTGFLRLNAWVGDGGQSIDDVRIAWTANSAPVAAIDAIAPHAEKSHHTPPVLAPTSAPLTTTPPYTVLFEDPLDSSGSIDLAQFAAAQDNSSLYFRVKGHSAWQNVLTDFTVIISIDSDADRDTGDPSGADHYVLIGAFPMQMVGVPAFVSNPQQEVLGVASYVVTPLNADSLEVGFDRTLLGDGIGRVFLTVQALTPDLSATFDILPNAAAASAWLTLSETSLSIATTAPQALPVSLASGLLPAAYDAVLFLDTNDPAAPSIALPVQFRSGVTPVTLYDLTATQERGVVQLAWRTADEVGIRAYRVFRALHNGSLEALSPDVQLEPQRRYSFRDAPPAPGSYAYRIGEVATSGEVSLHGLVHVDVVQAIPHAAFLDPNAPNPFNPRTRLSFGVDRSGPVSLQVFDARGRLVRTLLHTSALEAGYHERMWDGRDDQGRAVASGIYHVRLLVNGHVMTRRMTLLK